MEHEFYTGVSVLIMCIIMVKKIGPPLAAYLDKEMDIHEEQIEASRINEIKGNKELIEGEKKEQWRAEAQQFIIDAKKVNIAMQLEAIYRERIANVYNEVNIYYTNYFFIYFNLLSKILDFFFVFWYR